MAFLKKILGKGNQYTTQKAVSNPDVKPIGSFLQNKFSRGINYNMKIVIRGDRNVGKSALFARLKGESFNEQYIPSSEIQVASIHWGDRKYTDVVKVEVWDVVDHGKPRPSTRGLKFKNSDNQILPEPCLDASFLDVYKGANGVILVMDMTKSWTFDYVRQELPRIPPNLPVLILSNYRDMGEHRTVSEEEVRAFIEDEANGRVKLHLNTSVRSKLSAKRLVPVQYCEASMRNGFGLVYVHRFFSVPFLCLRRSVLQQQLKETQTELDGTVQALASLDGPLATTDEAYLTYVRMRRERARQAMAGVLPESVRSTAKSHDGNGPINAAVTNDLDFTSCISTLKQSNVTTCEGDGDEGDFVGSTSDTRNLKSDSQRQLKHTNPKVLTIQEDVDPNDVFHPISVNPPDAESWENVNLSLGSSDSSDTEDDQIRSPYNTEFDSPELTSTDHLFHEPYRNLPAKFSERFDRTTELDHSRHSPSLDYNSPVTHTDEYRSIHPIGVHGARNQTSPESLGTATPGDLVPKVIEEDGIDEMLVQSVLSTHEDEDALERFLSDS